MEAKNSLNLLKKIMVDETVCVCVYIYIYICPIILLMIISSFLIFFWGKKNQLMNDNSISLQYFKETMHNDCTLEVDLFQTQTTLLTSY